MFLGRDAYLSVASQLEAGTLPLALAMVGRNNLWQLTADIRHKILGPCQVYAEVWALRLVGLFPTLYLLSWSLCFGGRGRVVSGKMSACDKQHFAERRLAGLAARLLHLFCVAADSADSQSPTA